MIFTFEHMNVEYRFKSKWSAERFKLSKLKSVMKHMANGLQGNAWNSLYWNNDDDEELYQGLEMIKNIGKNQLKC